MNEQAFMELYMRDPAKALQAAKRAGLDPKRLEGLILSTAAPNKDTVDIPAIATDASAAPVASGPAPTPEELRQLLRSANLDRQAGFSEAEIDNNLLEAGWGMSYRALADSVKALPKQTPTTMTSKDVVHLMLSGATFGAPEAKFFQTLYPNKQARMKAIREENPALSKLAELIGSLSTGSVVGGAVKQLAGKTALNVLKGRIPEEIRKSGMHLEALIEARNKANKIGTLAGAPIGGAVTGSGWREDPETGAAVGGAAGTLGAMASRIPGIGGRLAQGATLAAALKYLTGK